jgi:glutaredoxin
MTLLKFTGQHCSACKKLDNLLELKGIEHRSLDVELYSSLAAKYQIMVLPTLVKLDENDHVVWKVAGFDPKGLMQRLKE